MIASIVAANAPLWLALCVMIWALLVSLSRIFTGMHYLSDVIAGMALGLLSGGVFLTAREGMQALFPYFF
jgi:undecaprenyl-diphosphatase